jgi:hypothetical protein
MRMGFTSFAEFWTLRWLAARGEVRQLPRADPQGGRLRALVSRFGVHDGEALLRVVEKHGLEGVVSKRRYTPYRSGACRGWRKIKTTAWRGANQERWRLFETPGREPKEKIGTLLLLFRSLPQLHSFLRARSPLSSPPLKTLSA